MVKMYLARNTFRKIVSAMLAISSNIFDFKRRLGPFFLLVVMLLSLAHQSKAGDEVLSARQLYEFCASSDQVLTTACRYFILGAIVGIELGDSAVLGPDRKLRARVKSHFCMPDDFRQSKMVDIFQNMIRALATKYPEDLNSPAISIVDTAMVVAFPCSRANR